MVEETRLRGEVITSINSTFLDLIPKVNKPSYFTDYRPISLCNLCYKIIAKVIAKRLRPILSRVVSEEQLGFLKGRKILDAIGTAQECLHNIKSKNLQAIILKLELKEGLRLYQLGFLEVNFLQSGFGINTTNWIMACVVSTSYATLINGEATKFFKSNRGLRQGCPLSPLLFILVMEGLSLSLKKAQNDGLLIGIKVSRLIKILHLLFVDDILIMSKASSAEWEKIQEILHVFCRASRLVINIQKSILLHSGVDPENLQSIKEFLLYPCKDLALGFKYLGYFLKYESYKIEDWKWLIDKFETRINHWCNKWLTLGGRYVLIKAVLESLPVYWMTLAHISLSVLHKIHRLSFSFLWSGIKNKHRYHLCSWHTIAKPKQLGGWGLRNIFVFYRALAMNTLWRALMKPGIWHRVIKDKYYPHVPVVSWLRSAVGYTSYGSQSWKNILNTLPIILHWLAWKLGSGHSIIIGRDAILGMGQTSFFLWIWYYELNRKHIYFLYQASRSISVGLLGQNWVSSTELGLREDLAPEWESFRRLLLDSGIVLTERRDELIWIGGDNLVTSTVKNVYNALSNKLWSYNDRGLEKAFMEMGMPLETKTFLLALIGKQNTYLGKICRKEDGVVLVYVFCVKKKENLASISLLVVHLLFQFGRELKLL
jgi:hypothetical protein